MPLLPTLSSMHSYWAGKTILNSISGERERLRDVGLGLHRRHTRTTSARPPTQANNSARAPKSNAPTRAQHMHLSTPGAARHLPLGRRGPATVSSPPQALGPVGMVCESACVSLRPCLCITKPILGVQVWPGVARASASVSSRVFGRRGVAPAPRL